jgi:hypothetical protein
MRQLDGPRAAGNRRGIVMKLSKRGLLVLALVAGLLPSVASRADTIGTNFDAYASGSIHGQDGWSSSGAAPALPGYDHEVTEVPRPLIPEYGAKSLRVSNDVVSQSFSDHTFSKSVANEAGEVDAANAGFSGGIRLGHFEAEWDFTSVLASYEPGLKMDFSPDRGDGARMSLVSLADTIPGLTLTFTDYQSGRFAPGCSDLNFVTTNLGSPTVIILDRFPVVHTLRITMDLLPGPSNDVVKVFVNGELVHTGTSWEDYFRQCEPGATSRTVDSILFRTGGVEGVDDCLECSEGGFFIDNLTIKTLGVRVIPTGSGTTVTEGGPCDTYTLVLEESPAPGTFVTVTLSTFGDITMSPTSVTFTSANWNVPRTITVCAIDDTVAEPPHTVQIHHNVASTDPNWDGISVVDMPVLVLDNDGPCVITESGGVTAVTEGGATDTYTVRLVAAPTANVTVSVSPDAQLTTSTASLVFTPANWNVPQTVTVTAVDDLLVEGLHFGVITHGPAVSADLAFNGQACGSVTAVITDNDPLDVIAPAAPIINCPVVDITTSSFLLTGTAEPGSSVTVFVDGSPRGTVPANASGNWQIQLQFTSNGTFTITATARDAAGNISAVSVACVIIVNADFTPPAPPVITSPADGAKTGACVTVTITFDADTDRLLIFDNGTQIANVDVNPPASPYSNTFCFTTGLHRLTAIAVDAAGNRSAPSNAVTITVDAEPPTVHITKQSLYILMQISIFNDPLITGIANDIHSGVDRIELSYEPVLPLLGASRATTATCPTCPSAPNVTTDWFDTPNPALGIGLYTVTATAYDLVGNSATAEDLLLFIF